MSSNRLRERLARGDTAIGGWCSIGSPLTTELLATAGLDYVCIDLQHGASGSDTLVAQLLAVSRTPATPVVRVPANDAAWIGKALDLGAEAVIVPMVEDVDAAARAAAACRYPPAGVRSFGPTRARLFLNEHPTDVVNRQVQCFVMIETVLGVERAAAITATEGVDGVYVGPSDLAVSIGAAPGSADDELEKLIESVRRACIDNGVVAGIHAMDGADARRRIEQGFSMVTVGTDAGLFRAAITRAMREARGEEA
ncbi:MAG TPA: aldolase/citrate lyase family protein [Acidimicrobiales bacterium]